VQLISTTANTRSVQALELRTAEFAIVTAKECIPAQEWTQTEITELLGQQKKRVRFFLGSFLGSFVDRGNYSCVKARQKPSESIAIVLKKGNANGLFDGESVGMLRHPSRAVRHVRGGVWQRV